MSNVGGNTFLPVLRQLAETDPDRPALTWADVTLTRAGLVARVERLAALFAAREVAESSTVTIALPNSTGFVESMFAARAVGAVPQPVSHRLPPPERAAIMDLARPSLVVGMPQPEAGAWPALEAVPQRLPAGPFTGRMTWPGPAAGREAAVQRICVELPGFTTTDIRNSRSG